MYSDPSKTTLSIINTTHWNGALLPKDEPALKDPSYPKFIVSIIVYSCCGTFNKLGQMSNEHIFIIIKSCRRFSLP